MSINQSYDVTIVGSGPAGSTLAYELASAGIHVVVIEKSKMPRYKCCGGGITYKTAMLLPPEIHDVFEETVFGMQMAFPGDCLFDRVSEEPIIYTVMRDKFDYALAKRAEAAGAVLMDGMAADKITVNGDAVHISAGGETFRAKFVVGADGANGITAKELGIELNSPRIIAIETEVRVSAVDLAKWKSRVMLELGRVKAGYAWVFPKADHLSIGIGAMPRNAKNLKKRYYEFLASLDLENYEIERWGSAFIPVCTGKPSTGRGRAILIGDAAGLGDPLTGEGIYNAVLSANLAGTAIKNALANGSDELSEYSRLIEDQIGKEMKIANTYSNLLTLFPGRLFNMVRAEDRVWRGACRLLRGERNYSDIKDRLNTLGGMYKFVFHR